MCFSFLRFWAWAASIRDWLLLFWASRMGHAPSASGWRACLPASDRLGRDRVKRRHWTQHHWPGTGTGARACVLACLRQDPAPRQPPGPVFFSLSVSLPGRWLAGRPVMSLDCVLRTIFVPVWPSDPLPLREGGKQRGESDVSLLPAPSFCCSSSQGLWAAADFVGSYWTSAWGVGDGGIVNALSRAIR